MKDSRAPVRAPAHLAPYVEVLGVDGAAEFFSRFGGGYLYLSLDPAPGSPAAEAVGVEKAAALARRLGAGSLRIPLGKPWVARELKRQGLTASAIARRLHATDVAVRGWLKSDMRQLTLFPVDD